MPTRAAAQGDMTLKQEARPRLLSVKEWWLEFEPQNVADLDYPEEVFLQDTLRMRAFASKRGVSFEVDRFPLTLLNDFYPINP